MAEQFFVYILYSPSADKYYIGHTNSVERRLREHNDFQASSDKFCTKNGPWLLKFSQGGFSTRADAVKRERQIKGWKSRKMVERLIADGGISSVGIPMQDRD